MKAILSAIVLALLLLIAGTCFHWGVNRVYVPEGQSLLLRYKGPFLTAGKMPEKGYWAQDGEIGVRQKLRGPGRHFYCPVWWERELINDLSLIHI